MPLQRWFEHTAIVSGAPDVHARRVSAEQWYEAAQAVAAHGGRLLTLWARAGAQADWSVIAALHTDPGVLLLELPCAAAQAIYPGLQTFFRRPAACSARSLMSRAS